MQEPRRRVTGTVVFLLLLAASDLNAQQTTRLQGTVTNSLNDRPVAGITVSLVGTRLVTLTSGDGTYRLLAVPPGEYTLQFSWLGYRTVARTVALAAGEQRIENAVLDPAPVPLGAISVTVASRQPERVVDAPAAVSVVDARRAATLSITGQAPEVLADLPGVDVVQSGAHDYNVNTRGFNTSLNRRVLVLQDGRDVSVPFLGAQEWSALSLPLEDFERIEFVRGPGSALYGANAFTGVINMITPTARQVRGTRMSLGGGELSTLRADLHHAGVSADLRWGWRMNAGIYRGDNWTGSRTEAGALEAEYKEILGAGDNHEIKPPLPGYELRALNGQTKEGPFGAPGRALGEPKPLEHIYGSARLDRYLVDGSVITFDAGNTRIQNQDFVTAIGRIQIIDADRPWARIAWAADKFNLMAYYSGRISGDQYSLATGEAVLEKSHFAHVEGQLNQAFAGGRGRYVAGASFRASLMDSDETIMLPEDDGRVDKFYSAFGQIEYEFSNHIRLVAAGRADESGLYDLQFSPKLALLFTPADNHTLRATVGRAFQTGNTAQYFLHVLAGPPIDLTGLESGLRQSPLGQFLTNVPQGQLLTNSAAVPVIAKGNRNLDVEKILSYDLGWTGQITDRVLLTTDLYYARLENFITDLLPGVNPAFQPWTAPAQVPANGKAAVEGAILQAMGPGFTRLNGNSALVISPGNAGEAREYGVEVSAGVQLTDKLRIDGTYTYFDFDVDASTLVPGSSVKANTPRHKGSLTGSFRGSAGDLRVAFRFVDSVDWTSGLFSGFVPARESVDVSGNWKVLNHVQIRLAATNLLDQRRYQFFGGSVIGRRVLAGLSISR
jgi:iron complex outermembrane receptor protein